MGSKFEKGNEFDKQRISKLSTKVSSVPLLFVLQKIITRYCTKVQFYLFISDLH